jgi:hypothetical protein
MKRSQKSIYSLLGLIESEPTDEAPREGTDWDGRRGSPPGIKEEPARGVVPEGGNRLVPEARLEGKAGDSRGRTSDDYIDKEVCSRCGKTELVRVRRQWWMRLFPKSQQFLCLECRARFLKAWPVEIELSSRKES